MANLNVFSCNLQGLNIVNKRAAFLDLLERNKIDVAMIQESHTLKNDIYKLENHMYKVSAFSSAPNKTKGVIILVRKKNSR